MEEFDYQYGGQWFDDMGALALAFDGAPVAGIDLARSGVSRAQANDMAANILRSKISPYDEDPIPDIEIGAEIA